MAILPMLPEACGEGFDWSTPIGEWPKETIAEFLLVAFTLVMRANAARDVVEAQGEGKPINPDLIARQINGVAGNPAMTVAEMRELDGGGRPPF